MLEDHRIAEPPRRLRDVVLADDGECLRGRDAEFAQRLVLRDLRELELQRALAVYHNGIMRVQPSQHRACKFGSIAMVPGVRRSAHPIVEYARRGRCAQVEDSLVEVPFGEWYAARAEM